jgi:hypothetical protein
MTAHRSGSQFTKLLCFLGGDQPVSICPLTLVGPQPQHLYTGIRKKERKKRQNTCTRFKKKQSTYMKNKKTPEIDGKLFHDSKKGTLKSKIQEAARTLRGVVNALGVMRSSPPTTEAKSLNDHT